MGRVLLFAIPLIVALIALIDCISTEPDEVRGLPRLLWVFVIVLIPLAGGLGWFAAGRPRPATAGTHPAGTGSGAGRRPTRPLAPDDDPEFLRNLSMQRQNEHEELLRRWEEDLRRREDEQKRRDEE